MSTSATPSRSNSQIAIPQASSLQSSRNNPISLRIYKAIGVTFDDPSSREALEIASSYYASPKGKSRADASEDGGEDILGRNGGLKRSLVGRGDTAAMARKGLKRDVEARLAGGSQKFLEAFGEVDKKLDVLREHMREMQVRCDQVQSELDQANSGTKYLLERADGLQSQRASAQLRSTLITLFLTRFTLSEAESTALTSREIPLGPPVFNALDRVEAIRRDCRSLLTGEEESMQAGLDIMAQTSEQLETGYRKIHRWCQVEFRQFTKDAQLEVSQIMREAIKRLGHRPVLLDDALQTLHSTRSSTLLQSFLEALTRGGPSGLPRPIELHAHDPQRYVGDMLAWVHQTTASEHEFLQGLFGVGEGGRRVGEERKGLGGKSMEETEREGQGEGEGEGCVEERVLKSGGEMVSEGLDKVLEGLGRPLKMRIQQTIKSQEGIIMTYKITNLLQFYLVTMRKTIGVDALLSQTLQEIYDLSYTAFLEKLDAQGRSLLRFLHSPDNTLTPPAALRDSAQILREIIQVHSSSLVDPNDLLPPPNSSTSKPKTTISVSFPDLLKKAVEPAVEMCNKMADLMGGATRNWEKDMFLVNCFGFLQHALDEYEGEGEGEGEGPEDGRVGLLDEEIKKHVESLTFEHHGKLLDQSGLSPILHTILNRPTIPPTPLSRLPTTSPKALTQALSTFSKFLSEIDVVLPPTRLALLGNRNLAEVVHRKALRRIAEGYGQVCERVLDKAEGYEFGETMLRRGREEVEVALGVERED